MKLPRIPPDFSRALAGLALVMILGAMFSADGAFFRASSHADALWSIAAFGILACGLTLVILTGGIDLSVGSLVALAGMVFYLSLAERGPGGSGWLARPGASVPLAAAKAIAVCAACGFMSGTLIAFFRLQPFIATLAMMAFARGLSKHLTANTKVSLRPVPAGVEWLNQRLDLLGFDVAIGILAFAVVAIACGAGLRWLRIGRYLYAVGDNEEASRLSGVPVRATKVLAYTLSGALAGIAGVLFASELRQGDPDSGIAYELTAIAMVVIGGTSLAGGRGGIALTVLGVLTIGYLRKILSLNAVRTPAEHMITGGIIAVAVLAQGLRRR